MANRPVYMPKTTAPYRTVWSGEFQWNSGFAVSQKQKNITALHNTFTDHFPGKKVLEISSKSMQDGGTQLSAFSLKKFVPSLGTSVPVENVFQAGKVFRNGGPYLDLLHVSPRDAKKDERLKNSGALVGFRFEGKDFPLNPQTIFYDYIYLNALLENGKMSKTVLEYDAFTDIEFNPERSVNCQAKSAALFVALARLDLLGSVSDFDSFRKLFERNIPLSATPRHTVPCIPVSVVPAAAETENTPALSAGDTVVHRVWGEGTVLAVNGTSVKLSFASVGEKTLITNWVLANCEIHPNA